MATMPEIQLTTKFEYMAKAKPNDQPIENFLNSRAREGWRFVQYLSGEGYIFERVTVEAKPAPIAEIPKPSRTSKRKSE